MVDLLWSDPIEENGMRKNTSREVGIYFGPDITQAFCRRNNLEYIVRSHQRVQEGAIFSHGDRCLTVFSAANYPAGMGNNMGAFVVIDDELNAFIEQFDHAEQPMAVNDFDD